MKGPLLHVLAFIYLHLGDHRMYHKEVNRGMVNQVSNINFQFWAFGSVGTVGKIYSSFEGTEGPRLTRFVGLGKNRVT